MQFLDAHCHLEHPKLAETLPTVLGRMQTTHTACVTHGTNASTNAATLELKKRHPDAVFAACGLDAFNASEDLDAHLTFLKENKDQLSAIGEIGLDQHHFTPDALPRQKEVFTAQLAFAEQNGLSAVIHTRAAVQDVLDLLPSFSCTKVLHFFLEKNFAPQALEQGCFLSLPTVQSKDRTWIAKNAPLEQLLCETDSPYGWKNPDGTPATNEPSNVREAYEFISKTRNIDLKDGQTQILKNARKVFNL